MNVKLVNIDGHKRVDAISSDGLNWTDKLGQVWKIQFGMNSQFVLVRFFVVSRRSVQLSSSHIVCDRFGQIWIKSIALSLAWDFFSAELSSG